MLTDYGVKTPHPRMARLPRTIGVIIPILQAVKLRLKESE